MGSRQPAIVELPHTELAKSMRCTRSLQHNSNYVRSHHVKLFTHRSNARPQNCIDNNNYRYTAPDHFVWLMLLVTIIIAQLY